MINHVVTLLDRIHNELLQKKQSEVCCLFATSIESKTQTEKPI